MDAYSRAQKVIDMLFPTSSLVELSSMTRKQLWERVQVCKIPERASDDISHGDLHVLEPHVEQNFTWDEVSEDESETSRVADDVNGLAFSQQSLNASYLGLSSVPTILRVITHLCPDVQRKVPKGPEAWRSPSSLGGSPDESSVLQVDETSLINAYFDHVHPSIPMVDEAEFRCRYDMTKGDESSSWLALLNMVLAMGSMASDSIHFTSHNVFYKRALLHLNIVSFGSGYIHMSFFPNFSYYKYSNSYLVDSSMPRYVGFLDLGPPKSRILESINSININPIQVGQLSKFHPPL
ncbi:hypothetical protein ACHAPD_007056 [Fusarium lateritium]